MFGREHGSCISTQFDLRPTLCCAFRYSCAVVVDGSCRPGLQYYIAICLLSRQDSCNTASSSWEQCVAIVLSKLIS